MTPPIDPLRHIERIRFALVRLPDGFDKNDALDSCNALDAFIREGAQRRSSTDSLIFWAIVGVAGSFCVWIVQSCWR